MEFLQCVWQGCRSHFRIFKDWKNDCDIISTDTIFHMMGYTTCTCINIILDISGSPRLQISSPWGRAWSGHRSAWQKYLRGQCMLAHWRLCAGLGHDSQRFSRRGQEEGTSLDTCQRVWHLLPCQQVYSMRESNWPSEHQSVAEGEIVFLCQG